MKVLIADDDPVSLMVAAAVVEQAGHQCITAGDGDVAWELFLDHTPEVVVTDWMMPGLDGMALCRAIRKTETDSYTYLVLLTSLGSEQDVLTGLEAGVDDYVTKPLEPFTLRTRLLIAGRVTSLHAQLGRYRQDLARQARTDPLTGLNNRLKLREDVELMHSRSQRYGGDYSLALCDVDHFKTFNDLYGHPAGDEALKAIAGTLDGQLRKDDGIYRYGGEEFLLLLPGQDVRAARAVVERVRAAVQALGMEHAGNAAGVLTLSAGICGFNAERHGDGSQVLREADMALYKAKAAGRNRVAVAQTETGPAS